MASKKTPKNHIETADVQSTKDVPVPAKLIDQVVGQEKAVTIIKKAAAQKRNVLLVGSPGTGKSLLAQAMSELLPISELEDILVKPNPDNENTPKIVSVKKGEGKKIIQQERLQNVAGGSQINLIVVIFLFASFFFLLYFGRQQLGDVITAALLLMLGLTGIVMIAGAQLGRGRFALDLQPSKLLVDNSKSATAPFMEATGARAGALLGDCRHDPFQSFCNNLKIVTKENGVLEKINLNEKVDSRINQGEGVEKREEKNYEAVSLAKKETKILGELNGKTDLVELISCNRYDYEGELIKITTNNGKEIVTTPEHRLAIITAGKITYKEAKEIGENDQLAVNVENLILDEQDIIETYNENEIEQCRLYRKYHEVKQSNPQWGFKKIAKAIGQPYHKTRWWHTKKRIPIAIQNVEWLKQRGLLPLTFTNGKLPRIAKIIGTTFGDGGIFENLNGIFLSSSEKQAVEEFVQDLEEVFDLTRNENSRIIEGGEYGHSWCSQNSNRNIIRFFIALGAARGNKTKQNLTIPNWVSVQPQIEDEFYGSLLGNEIGIPKLHVDKNRTNTLDFAITGEEKTKESRMKFLESIQDYLSERGVRSNIISQRKTKEDKILFRILFSTDYGNLVKFFNRCKLNFATHKQQKLRQCLLDFAEEKRKRYYKLVQKGYGAHQASNMLKLDLPSLHAILNDMPLNAHAITPVPSMRW